MINYHSKTFNVKRIRGNRLIDDADLCIPVSSLNKIIEGIGYFYGSVYLFIVSDGNIDEKNFMKKFINKCLKRGIIKKKP